MTTDRSGISSVGTANLATTDTASASATTATAITESIIKEPIVQNTSKPSFPDEPVVGHPREQLEVEESGTSEENIVFPTGPKLWLTYISLCIAMFLHGLDLAVVAVAVPRLTDHFKTISDIGWYSAAYPVVACSFIFFFGKCYSVFRTKYIYLFGLITFEFGSLLCTLAPTSKGFIVGRAVAGLGASAFTGGMMKLLKDMFPMSKQALYCGIVGAGQGIGLVCAPMVGGALIDAFSWRACFGVNLPLGVLVIAFTMWAFEEPKIDPELNKPLKEKLKQLDLFSTVLVVPAITCLLLGLQWGGIKYGWRDGRIIGLFVLFVILFTGFGYSQYRLGERAMVPMRIVKQRNILGALWFCSCCNGILAVTEYYISIYYQGVRGYTPTKSGLLGLPMLVGFSAATMLSASGTTIIGYYYPFLFATSILSPIASGLLTTIDLDSSIVKPAALLGFLGVAIGIGVQGPMMAIQTTLSSKDVSIGSAIVGFGGGIGSAMWVCVSSTLFQNRLGREINKFSPSTNATSLELLGLSDVRTSIGSNNLRNVLLGYNEAVIQTLYLPLALCILTIFGSITIERRSIKKKQS